MDAQMFIVNERNSSSPLSDELNCYKICIKLRDLENFLVML